MFVPQNQHLVRQPWIYGHRLEKERKTKFWCIVKIRIKIMIKEKKFFLPDPRRAGHVEAFQKSSVRPSVHTSPIRSVLSYSANIPLTPNIFTDSGPPIK